MDRLSQADEILAAALAYSPSVIVPGHALSPMDCDSTIPVTRMMVRACDRKAHGLHDGGSYDAEHAEAHLVLDAEMILLSRGGAIPRPRTADRSA